MATTVFTKRINLEIKSLKDCPMVSAEPQEDNLRIWNATIQGPIDTPYEGGIFKLQIKLPERYPFVAPKVKFLTKIFHPNIDENEICIDFLEDKWSPVLNISKILLSISSMLIDPNPESALNDEAAELYENDIDKYNETIRDYVKQFASE